MFKVGDRVRTIGGNLAIVLAVVKATGADLVTFRIVKEGIQLTHHANILRHADDVVDLMAQVARGDLDAPERGCD